MTRYTVAAVQGHYKSLDGFHGCGLQAIGKTGPEATRKLRHPTALSSVSDARLIPADQTGLADVLSAHTAGPMACLEGVMQTPEGVALMRQLLTRGLSQRRIARELGISRHTVSRYAGPPEQVQTHCSAMDSSSF